MPCCDKAVCDMPCCDRAVCDMLGFDTTVCDMPCPAGVLWGQRCIKYGGEMKFRDEQKSRFTR
jgi:hypothetical protein